MKSQNHSSLSTLILMITFSIMFSMNISKLNTNKRILAETKKNTTPQSGELICNNEMMSSYGLEGLPKPSTTGHEMCPSITHNCCSADDSRKSMEYWMTDSMRKIEAYYETYLYSIKYLLGFSYEVDQLASHFIANEEGGSCKRAAEEYKTMNINRAVSKQIFRSFVETLEHMANIRRGFYCVLCDATTQSRLKDYWSITNVFYSDRMYYNQEFCQELVERTIRGAYYEIFYLKRYSQLTTTLMKCSMNSTDTTPITYDISYWNTQQVKNCFYYKDKYFFFFCEGYCERFHITKATSLMDGNLDQLKKFVRFVAANRKDAFYNPGDNFMLGGVGWEEGYMEENFQEFEKNPENAVFFKSVTNEVQLDKFETDILIDGGFNPMDSVEGSLYPIQLASQNIISSIMITLLIAISLNK